jgi:hypothetical protein
VSRRFAIYIALVGLAALAVIAWPGLVLVGLFLGIVPGILLWIAPSLFLYSFLWWCLRTILFRFSIMVRIAGGTVIRLIVSVLSGAIVAALAIQVPHLIDMRTEAAAESLRVGDLGPDKPIGLPSVVALVMEGSYNYAKRKPFCETLCLRLLFNSSVARVIAVDPAYGNATTAFWIERRQTCPDRPNVNFSLMWSTDFPLVRGDTPEDRVRARIADGDCLMEGDGRPDEAAMTISYRIVQNGVSTFDRPWSLQPGAPTVKRIEISEATGATIYRRTEVSTVLLNVPLRVETAAGLLTTVTYVGWSRSNKVLGQIGPQGRDVLPVVLGPAARKPETDSPRNRSP